MADISLFLFGNGLSMALSKEFSLRLITQNFIKGLDETERDFLIEICGGKDEVNFDDFEENFSKIEDAYNSLVNYNRFIKSDIGQKFLIRFKLRNPKLGKHEKIIKSIYNKYIFQILEIIRSKVTKAGIQKKLPGFTDFLKKTLNGNKGYVFTLNYDLLAEAIMLEEIGTENMTDFCCSTGNFKDTTIPKFDFDPAMSEEYYGEYFLDTAIELHHLHGSLSLFYDYSRNKAIKFINDDIFHEDIYNRILKDGWTLYPAIITGGGKSSKINDYPFEFYFRKLKDLCTYAKFNKLFIVGYSFRDEHVNELIKRWMKSVEDYTQGLLIVNYKEDKEGEEKYKKIVRKQIRKQTPIPDSCFEFGGVNKIHDVKGTVAKKKV